MLAASHQLGYQPNELVRGIFGRRSFTVGLITSDSFGRFSGPVMAGAEDALGLYELSVLMGDSRGDVKREQRHVHNMIGRRIDGLIVTGRCSNPRPPVARVMPFPVVYAHTPSTDPNDCCVVVDDTGAGRLAAQHLLEAGRRRIAHVTGPLDFAAVRQRAAGLTDALAQAGLPVHGGARAGAWSEAWGRQAAKMLLEETPEIDAVYCGSDLIARGVADGLALGGRSVPDDIALVGTDNWQLLARGARPALTTIDMRLSEVGRLSAHRLIEGIEGTMPSGTHVVPASVVVRASTGFPYEDPASDIARNYHDDCIHNV